MKNNISVKPDKTSLNNLLEDLFESQIKIPIFQRDFVWKADQMLELFDSIAKGYPIGSLLFWKPSEEKFETKPKIGPYTLDGDAKNVSYVLDGFQRITTLFSVLTNPKKVDSYYNEREIKDFTIYYNLFEKEFCYIKNQKEKNIFLIPLYKVIDTFEFLDYLREIENEIVDKHIANILIENAKKLSKIFWDYEIPFVEIRGGDIKSAVEIFSRINSTGTEISEDFMLSALSYNSNTNFLFSEEISKFLNSLSIYNFSELKRDTILNCIATSKGKIYFDVKIEELLKPDLENLTNDAFIHIRKAVEFLYYRIKCLNSRLLPYPTQLIFISEFFRINQNPDEWSLNKLVKWFWFTSYSNYFTIYSLSQQRKAYKQFIEFAYGHRDDSIFIISGYNSFETAAFPSKLNYSSVRSKVLQLFYLNRLNINIDQIEIGIKEQFLFKDVDKLPANMILRFSDEFENNIDLRRIENFIYQNNNETLDMHFISSELVNIYSRQDIFDFIILREQYIKSEEEKFVSDLGIKYQLI